MRLLYLQLILKMLDNSSFHADNTKLVRTSSFR